MNQTEFFVLIADPLKQQWLCSLLQMCFPNGVVNNLCALGDVPFDTITDREIIICTTEKELGNISEVLQDHHTLFPVLVISGKSQRSPKSTEHEHFTVEIVPSEMLSPGLLKLAVSSLLRDHKKEQQLRLLAHFDPLTNTANRHLFYDRLKQAIKQSRRNSIPLTVLYFDLDKFKPVNDNYGHHVGDALLKSFAKKVRSCLREVDTLGRLGGDEFAAILSGTPASEAEATAQRILQALATEEEVEGHMLAIQSSMGVLTYESMDKLKKLPYTKVMQEVDQVTYLAKKTGQHSYVCKAI